MRVFLWKLGGLLLVCVVLVGYQSYALARQERRSAYEAETAAAKEAQALAAEQEAAEKAQAAEETTEEEASWQDGSYEGSGEGFGGEITVKIEIQNHEITEIEVASAEGETPEYLRAAKAVLDEIIEAQSVDVDAVSGATFSSNGILEAVNNALSQAEM